MKKLLFIFALFVQSNTFACEECVKELINFISTMEKDGPDQDYIHQTVNLYKGLHGPSYHYGLNIGIRFAVSKFNENHPETHLTLSQYTTLHGKK